MKWKHIFRLVFGSVAVAFLSLSTYLFIRMHYSIDSDPKLMDSVFLVTVESNATAIAETVNQSNIATNDISDIIIDIIPNDTITIGYCCDDVGCLPQPFVISMAENTFPQRTLFYQQCSGRGLAPPWTVNYTNPDNTTLFDSVSLDSNQTYQSKPKWIQPDILLCQGWFYDATVVASRLQRSVINITDEMRSWATQFDINLQNTAVIYKHERGFPLVWTRNLEPWGGNCGNRYDVIMDTSLRPSPGCVSIYVPPSFWYEYKRDGSNISDLIRANDAPPPNYWDSIALDKTEFALFLVRQCFATYYQIDALVRVVFFELLSREYKNVTSLSDCRRTKEVFTKLKAKNEYCPKGVNPGTKEWKRCKDGATDGAVKMLKPYKFALSMENTLYYGYSTEKIMNAFYAHSIPIYFGDPLITQYINNNSYIHCHINDTIIVELRRLDKKTELSLLEQMVSDLVKDSLMVCVKRVIEIDTNEQFYRSMLSAPVFPNNDWHNTAIDPSVIGAKMRAALRLHNSHLVPTIYGSTQPWLN